MLHITTTTLDRRGNIRYKLYRIIIGKVPELISWHRSYEKALKAKYRIELIRIKDVHDSPMV